MNCPRCNRSLEVVSVGGVNVDVCQNGCGGIWFDLFELEKMDQPDESAGWLLDNMRIDLALSVDYNKHIDCPRCSGISMMRQSYHGNRSIMIDKCQSCGGTWLDFGELFAIRSGNPATEEHRAGSANLLRDLKIGLPSQDSSSE